MGGWLEIWRVKLISTQVIVEVEVGMELGKNNLLIMKQIGLVEFSTIFFLNPSLRYVSNIQGDFTFASNLLGKNRVPDCLTQFLKACRSLSSA